MLLVAAPVAEAGKKKRKEDDVAEVAPAPAPTVAPYTGLFDGVFPFPVGAVPEGLANLSAQGCAACHPTAAAAWRRGAHARPPSEALLAAIEDVGNPACGACHRPLDVQQSEAFAFAFGVDRTEPGPAGPFDATLRTEGVTCAACHVRDGLVLGTQLEAVSAPHPVRPAPALSSPDACRACHQLEVGGVALYDTVGEWERSPHAAAGIGCLDCHGSGGPDGAGTAGHTAAAGWPGASLLVTIDRDHVVRGGPPLEVGLLLQNTGAGHSWPSGGPWSGARLVATLTTLSDEGMPVDAARFAVDLSRSFTAAWEPTADTRVPAGGQASWAWSPQVPQDAPPGPYTLQVEVVPTARGEVSGPPVLAQILRLRTD